MGKLAYGKLYVENFFDPPLQTALIQKKKSSVILSGYANEKNSEPFHSGSP
jgi:hypothetical protein